MYYSSLPQEAQNFTHQKNNFDLLCTVNFAIVIHPDQDEKQVIFTALLLVWLEKWLEKTV